MLFRHSAKLGLTLIFFALMILCKTPTIASIIQIETTTSITVAGDRLKVEVTATNKGDIPAYNVQVHIMLLGQKLSGLLKDQLKQGESETVVFERILPASIKGQYPLITLVNFQDTNLHPFSAVSCSSFSIKEGANPNLECLGNDTSLAKNGLLRFMVRNRGPTSRTIRATLVLPEELSTPVPQRDFLIGPGAEEVLVFEIHNFCALSGANYPVFCYLEYDSGDSHYTKVGETFVGIVKTENWFWRVESLWLGAAIILGVILVTCQFKRKGS